MFPLHWEMTRGYRFPTRALGEPYFIRWSPLPRPRGEGWNGARFHDDGVIAINHFRNPVQIAQFALHEHARWSEGDAGAAARFLDQARYLERAQREGGGYPYPIALPAYHAAPGFLSGMAQGEAASVLLRAFALTGDERFITAGLRALEPLRREVASGGASWLRGNEAFFEEVAAEPACHILNGHLFAAFAVWEYVTHGFGDAELYALHERAVNTLERWIERYDAGGWSCYDLAVDERGRRHEAPLWYHQFHIAQLRVYAHMTERAIFSSVAERWHEALQRLDVRAHVWRYNAQSLAQALARRTLRRPRRGFVPVSEASHV